MSDPEYTTAWTAISRPPYLTALALWPKGESWDGGGLFLSETDVWLAHTRHRAEAHPDHRPRGLTVSHSGEGVGEPPLR